MGRGSNCTDDATDAGVRARPREWAVANVRRIQRYEAIERTFTFVDYAWLSASDKRFGLLPFINAKNGRLALDRCGSGEWQDKARALFDSILERDRPPLASEMPLQAQVDEILHLIWGELRASGGKDRWDMAPAVRAVDKALHGCCSVTHGDAIATFREMYKVVAGDELSSQLDWIERQIRRAGFAYVRDIGPETPFKPLRTKNEVKAWLRAKYPWMHAEFEGLSLQLVNRSVKTFDDLAAVYPEVAATIEFFGVDEWDDRFDDNDGLMAMAEWCNYSILGQDRQQQSIRLSPKYFASERRLNLTAQKLRKEAEQSQVEHFVDMDCTPEGLTTHEFGHNVHFHLLRCEQLRPDDAIEDAQAPADSVRSWLASNTDEISGYAGHTPYERFAETFTALHHKPELAQSHPSVASLGRFLAEARERGAFTPPGGGDGTGRESLRMAILEARRREEGERAGRQLQRSSYGS